VTNKGYLVKQPRKAGKRVPYGKITETRIAFTKTAAGTIAFYRLPNDPELAESDEEREQIENGEIGPHYRLTFMSAHRKIDYYLTSLTEEELDAVKGIMEFAFELARPVTRARDRMAQDAFTDGDDSFTRIYRPAAQFVIRNREAAKYDQSILDRSRAAFDRERSGRDSAIDPGVSGSVLAPVESERIEAKDNQSTVDESEDLREMDGSSSDVQGLQGTDTSGHNPSSPS
jgi:hypothetical protein